MPYLRPLATERALCEAVWLTYGRGVPLEL